jgi:hypothetical protein
MIIMIVLVIIFTYSWNKILQAQLYICSNERRVDIKYAYMHSILYFFFQNTSTDNIHNSKVASRIF